MTTMSLGHVHLKVRELDTAVDFYARHFGLHAVERIEGQYAFLSFGKAHHDLALQAVGPEAPGPVRAGVGLYHIAFEVPDPEAFLGAWDRLREDGLPHVAVDHGISWAVYFQDPDGNGLEIYADRRGQRSGRDAWEGGSSRLTREDVIRQLSVA